MQNEGVLYCHSGADGDIVSDINESGDVHSGVLRDVVSLLVTAQKYGNGWSGQAP